MLSKLKKLAAALLAIVILLAALPGAAIFAQAPPDASSAPVRASAAPNSAGITFSAIPELGTLEKNIAGFVTLPDGATNYVDYVVTVWIRLTPGGTPWGPKPDDTAANFASPLSDYGRFSLRFISGDSNGINDLSAAIIQVFLMPKTLTIAQSRDYTYLTANCITSATISRTSGTIQVDGETWAKPDLYSSFRNQFPAAYRDASTAAKYAVNYSPYTNGLRPGSGAKPTESQIRADLERLALDFEWIRLFSVESDFDIIYTTAQQLGLKVIATAWIDDSMTSAQVQEQLNRLINLANAGKATIACIGSETQFRGDFTAAQMLNFVNTVKAGIAAPVPVAYMDVSSVPLNKNADPNIKALNQAVDIILISHYPVYSNNYNLSWMNNYPFGLRYYAIDETVQTFREVEKNIPLSTPLYLAEVGWPTDGTPIGISTLDGETSRDYFDKMTAWSKISGNNFFWFSAYDESYKASINEGGLGTAGGHFGLFNADRTTKPAFIDLFQTYIPPDPRYRNGFKFWRGESAEGWHGNTRTQYIYSNRHTYIDVYVCYFPFAKSSRTL